MKARVEEMGKNGKPVVGKKVIEQRGPVQYSGPDFMNQWPIPEGARHVVIRIHNAALGSFMVEFTK